MLQPCSTNVLVNSLDIEAVQPQLSLRGGIIPCVGQDLKRLTSLICVGPFLGI